MYIFEDCRLEATKKSFYEYCHLRFVSCSNNKDYLFWNDEDNGRQNTERFTQYVDRETILKKMTNDLFILIDSDRNAQLWYYVLADADKKELLSDHYKANSIQNIEDYGTVLYSGWGEDPPESISKYVGIKYFFMESKNENFDKNPSYPLHDSARNGDLGAVEYLLTKGENVNSKDYNGWTPLHHSAFSGNLKIVKLLVSENSNIYAEDFTSGRQPILIAAREGHVDVVKFFLDTSTLEEQLWTDTMKWIIPWSIKFKDDNGWGLLHYAAWKGHFEMVEFIINSGASINVNDTPSGKTPFHVAAAQGHTNIVEFLLNRGMNIDSADYDGRTALCYSAQNGHFETTKFLINIKKKTSDKIPFSSKVIYFRDIVFRRRRKDSSQKSPLHLATANSHLNIINLLLTSGVNIDIVDKHNRTPLHYAASHGLLEAATLLVEQGADLYAESKDGLWPVQYAASKGHLIVTELFLSNGLDIHRTDKNGRSLFHYVTSIGQFETVRFLLDRGISMYAETKEGLLPVHIAASNGYLNIIELFLNRGMNIEAVDKDGRTAFYYAAWKGHVDVLKFLIDWNANIHAENVRGVTPLHAASDADVKRFLIKNGARMEDRDKDGQTPLFYSVIDNCLDDVKLLVNEGANIRARDNDGKTPLDIAREKMYLDVESFLISIYHKECEFEDLFCIYQGELIEELLTQNQFSYFPHSNVKKRSVRQGLYIPAFRSRGVEYKGICYLITHCFSQALFFQNEELFLNNMETAAEVYERLAQGRQVSAREEHEVFAFSQLLDHSKLYFSRVIASQKRYFLKTLSDLSNNICNFHKRNFVIYLYLQSNTEGHHIVAVYRIGGNYAYFDTNDAFISGLSSIEQLTKIVKQQIMDLYGKHDKSMVCYTIDFIVNRANFLLSMKDRKILFTEIKTERQLLAHQDNELGLININGHQLSRIQLYDLGTQVHIKGSTPMLINADHNLNSKKILDYLNAGEISMSARDYLLKCRHIKVKEATEIIPFIGSSREIREAKQLQLSSSSYFKKHIIYKKSIIMVRVSRLLKL